MWGYGIPSTAKFICGTSPCQIVAPLKNDTRLPAHGQVPQFQKVVVKFLSGSGIKLEGYNTLPFQLTTGKITYVNAGGNINNAISSAGAGDVIYLRGRTYRDTSPSGSYNALAFFKSKGNVALSCYPNEACVLDVTVARG